MIRASLTLTAVLLIGIAVHSTIDAHVFVDIPSLFIVVISALILSFTSGYLRGRGVGQVLFDVSPVLGILSVSIGSTILLNLIEDPASTQPASAVNLLAIVYGVSLAAMGYALKGLLPARPGRVGRRVHHALFWFEVLLVSGPFLMAIDDVTLLYEPSMWGLLLTGGLVLFYLALKSEAMSAPVAIRNAAIAASVINAVVSLILFFTIFDNDLAYLRSVMATCTSGLLWSSFAYLFSILYHYKLDVNGPVSVHESTNLCIFETIAFVVLITIPPMSFHERFKELGPVSSAPASTEPTADRSSSSP